MLLKNASCRLLKKIQVRGARKSTSGGVLTVRCSEAIERQRSIWVFFSNLLDSVEHRNEFHLPCNTVIKDRTGLQAAIQQKVECKGVLSSSDSYRVRASADVNTRANFELEPKQRCGVIQMSMPGESSIRESGKWVEPTTAQLPAVVLSSTIRHQARVAARGIAL